MRTGGRESATTHGHAFRNEQTRTYKSWGNMKSRCFDPKSTAYERYGARGITVCERWLFYENFLADMGECPEGLTIERRDNNGNYESSNCYWATTRQQNNNNRRTTFLEFDGERKSLSYWADHCGIAQKTLRSRIFELGWTVERALTTPPPSDTHCPHGHAWTEENTAYTKIRGKYTTRFCRTCDRLRAREKRRKAKENGN